MKHYQKLLNMDATVVKVYSQLTLHIHNQHQISSWNHLNYYEHQLWTWTAMVYVKVVQGWKDFFILYCNSKQLLLWGNKLLPLSKTHHYCIGYCPTHTHNALPSISYMFQTLRNLPLILRSSL